VYITVLKNIRQFPKEEEPKLMTLDEWKALQTKKEPKFNLRKAGEG
jgi:hypothetical protein